MLVKAKLISPDQLKKAVDMQKILGGKLGAIIVKLGFISDEGLTRFLAKQENLPITDLSKHKISKELAQSLPREVLEKHQVIPIQSKGGILKLAISDPTDFEAIEEVQFLTNCQVDITMASRAQIARELTRLFYGDEGVGAEEADTETVPETAAPAQKQVIEPGWEKALIPLLIDKGIITAEELKEKAQELE